MVSVGEIVVETLEAIIERLEDRLRVKERMESVKRCAEEVGITGDGVKYDSYDDMAYALEVVHNPWVDGKGINVYVMAERMLELVKSVLGWDGIIKDVNSVRVLVSEQGKLKFEPDPELSDALGMPADILDEASNTNHALRILLKDCGKVKALLEIDYTVEHPENP